MVRDEMSGDVREPIERGEGSTAATDCLALPVLVLNRLFAPIRITTARRAFGLLYLGSASAVDERGELLEFAEWRVLPIRLGDDALPIVNGAVRVPRIVHLRRCARSCPATLRLTRRNLMLRDGSRCQYCGAQPGARELDIDHVLPRSRGGEDSWSNLVTACLACNRRKGHRSPLEAGMPLLRPPVTPRWSVTMLLLAQAPTRYKEWELFLEAS
jgi:5-methylcytosine-specific restriction endonuclease McrA